MSEFKFSCPSCKQHIKIVAEFEGRRIECPSCKAPLIVPAPPKGERDVPAGMLVQPAVVRMPAAPEQPTVAPAAPAPASAPPVGASQPATPSPESDSPFDPRATGEGEADTPVRLAVTKPITTAAQISNTRVPELTPKLKLETVRAVRIRLADKSLWLPGKKGAGLYNYAARFEGDVMVPVSATDALATHYSLFGAVLLELHRRHLGRATTIRRNFLDEEFTSAIQQLLGRKPDEAAVSEAEREALTHEQCLAVLDILEERYRCEAGSAKKQHLGRKIDLIRLADLVRKLETSSPVKPEEVACALCYELEEIKQRLEELEQNAHSSE